MSDNFTVGGVPLGQDGTATLAHYRPGPSQVATPPFAGFWLRFAAYLLDVVILLGFGFVIGILAGFAIVLQGGDPENSPVMTLLTIVLWISNLAYYVGFPATGWQATPGKRMCGIYIARPDGTRISFLRSLGRQFAMVLSALILFVGYIMVAFTAEKTALHDLIADTRVYRGKPGA